MADIYPQRLREGRIIKGMFLSIAYEDLGSLERIFSANMAILDNFNGFKYVEILHGFKQARRKHLYW